MKKIGILRGMETTFPDTLIPFINENYGKSHKVKAEFVMLDAIKEEAEPEWDVIVDRISHEVPFYRSFLKWAVLKGTYVVNNPFWWSTDDKFIDNLIARKAGVAVPRTLILPHREHMPNTKSESYRNLNFPLDWEGIASYIGFPAYMKPHDGGGWRGVSKIHNMDELFGAYNESGISCMMLQESIEFEEYYRCYGIGRKHVRVMRYNPKAPHHARYSDVDPNPIPEKTLKKLERDVLALCNALSYDINTVEFAVRDGIPYAIDFMNPAPDADRNSVGEENFKWVLETVAAFLVEKAVEKRKKPDYNPQAIMGFYV